MKDQKKIRPFDPDREISRRIRKRTVISFLAFAALITLAIAGWNYLIDIPQGGGAGIRKPMRNVLELNHGLFSGIFSRDHLARVYPKSAAVKNVRVNGSAGLRHPADTANWKLHLVKSNGDTLLIGMDDIKRLPKTEIIFDFKCIEGWDQITHWGGVKLSDFMNYYRLDQEKTKEYIGFVTPDKGYYVGIDMPSALHPQTLLCYEMNGKALPFNQGYPLRLIIPVKYGIKSLKLIGTMYFSNARPRDYWAERGYDYYSGL